MEVSLSICREVVGLDAIILVFGMLNFKPPFSLFCFTFINSLFSLKLHTILLFTVVTLLYIKSLYFITEGLKPLNNSFTFSQQNFLYAMYIYTHIK